MKVRTAVNHRETRLVALKLFICLLLLFHFVKDVTIYLNRVQDKHTVFEGHIRPEEQWVCLQASHASSWLRSFGCGGMFGLSFLQKCLSSALVSVSATTLPELAFLTHFACCVFSVLDKWQHSKEAAGLLCAAQYCTVVLVFSWECKSNCEERAHAGVRPDRECFWNNVIRIKNVDGKMVDF